LSAAFVSLTAPPSAAFFLSAITSSRPAKLTETRIEGITFSDSIRPGWVKSRLEFRRQRHMRESATWRHQANAAKSPLFATTVNGVFREKSWRRWGTLGLTPDIRPRISDIVRFRTLNPLRNVFISTGLKSRAKIGPKR
jgi:hypothetical protein